METLPAWNNQNEYQAIHSPDFEADLNEALRLTEEIGQAASTLPETFTDAERPALIGRLRDLSAWGQRAQILLANLRVFVDCELAVDAKNAAAVKGLSRIHDTHTGLATALMPWELFLVRCEDSLLSEYLNSETTRSEAFHWQQRRRSRDRLLTTVEETALEQFKSFGLNGWGRLYDQIAGSLKVHLPDKGEIGAAQAAGYLRHSDPIVRKEAWQGLQTAWKIYEEPCAAILNNLVGYRLEEYKKRSQARPMDFLEVPLLQARIEAETLRAMMDTVHERIEIPRRAMRLMALCMGKTQIDPWDILAPSPRAGRGQSYSFAKALEVIRSAFASLDPAMGDFLDLMVKNQWIEARVLPNKRPGAFCTGFLKSETPRVFQTFMGSYNDVSTLAHELGHAFHSWVMRDLPFSERIEYPMTLAETASIFAETLLSERLAETGDAETRFAIAWSDTLDASAFLANIPARFEFEKALYEARVKGTLSPDELSEMTDKAWRKWYGQEISQTERQYWMTKLHFSISELSFYNYPYTFGYLFSLGVYAKRAEMGPRFFGAYVDLLRDTGRMTAEDLIAKHLGQDIRKPDFWHQSLDIVENKVAQFEKLMQN